jgi:ABC-type oligopeptide transport system substrate-binding subunit
MVEATMARRLHAAVWTALLWGIAVVVPGTCAAGPEDAQVATAPVRFLYAGGSLERSTAFDPAYATSPFEERLVLACFDPLTTIDPETGAVKGLAAESWTTSPDGKTWTFTLRKGAKWFKRTGGKRPADAKWEEQRDVTARDFVFAWKRLIEPDTVRPKANSRILDVLPGCRAVSFEGLRSSSIDNVCSAIRERMGAGETQTIKGDEVATLLGDSEIAVRKWCAECADPAVRKFLTWNPRDPMVPARAKEILKCLDAEVKALRAINEEARSHVGVDRGFWAKDDRTLVVQTEGVAPWLPSLLSRAALAPLNEDLFKTRAKYAFQAYYFLGNGAYAHVGEIPNAAQQYWVELLKNPKHWNAAAVPSDEVRGFVTDDGGAGDIADKWKSGELQWAELDAFRDAAPKLRAAHRDPAWKPTSDTSLSGFPEVAKSWYDVSGRGTFVLRFRCVAPFDKPEVRKALAGLIDRAWLAKASPAGSAPITQRFVSPRVTGATEKIALPTFDAKGIKKTKYLPDNWIKFAAIAGDDEVGTVIGKLWAKVAVEDDVTVFVPEDFAKQLDMGDWHCAVSMWVPAFDDPLAYLAPFTTGNNAGWSDARYDALIRAAQDVAAFGAAKEIDPAIKDLTAIKSEAAAGAPAALESARRKLLAAAEERLLAEAVVVPLWTEVESGVVRPKVRGVTGLGAWASKTRNALDVHSLTTAAPADDGSTKTLRSLRPETPARKDWTELRILPPW